MDRLFVVYFRGAGHSSLLVYREVYCAKAALTEDSSDFEIVEEISTSLFLVLDSMQQPSELD